MYTEGRRGGEEVGQGRLPPHTVGAHSSRRTNGGKDSASLLLIMAVSSVHH